MFIYKERERERQSGTLWFFNFISLCRIYTKYIQCALKHSLVLKHMIRTCVHMFKRSKIQVFDCTCKHEPVHRHLSKSTGHGHLNRGRDKIESDTWYFLVDFHELGEKNLDTTESHVQMSTISCPGGTISLKGISLTTILPLTRGGTSAMWTWRVWWIRAIGEALAFWWTPDDLWTTDLSMFRLPNGHCHTPGI